MKIYAQLDENNICIGVSQLNDAVAEYNYATEQDYDPVTGKTTREEKFVSRMIEIQVYSENYIGLHYNKGTWEKLEEG